MISGGRLKCIRLLEIALHKKRGRFRRASLYKVPPLLEDFWSSVIGSMRLDPPPFSLKLINYLMQFKL